ncbi:HAD family hydrolase [Nakamurella antarctica]|uniref:HAD family hydrolase n=1 Tax=Nakamurella antarctica TaxID=1902245 RepID=A0A3G8ZJM5_9ACTN|nr:HAD family hydrolase [Nakamurella antarctica]AZI57045.1 HAD family hydrolase [Nakamurella antarctica]
MNAQQMVAAPRMVVSDMDGTLLDGAGLVSPRNAAALRRAADSGAHVVIATGRPIWWLSPVIDAGFTGTAVCMNGAVTYDIAAGEITSCSPLEVAPMQDFVANLHAREEKFALAVERIGVDLDACWAEHHYEHPWEDGFFQRGPREHLLSLPVAKLLVRSGNDSGGLAHHAREAAGAQVSVTFSTDDGLIEVAGPGVNKGTALDRLAKQWGIAAADVVAFGDMPNDLEMLSWAGHGVAMANAHADVAAIANEITGFHHEDGVALVLERWF